MFYEIKFLCDNDIYTVTLTLPEDIYVKKSIDDVDSLLSDCIRIEKEMNDVSTYPHTIISMRKTANDIDWIEMI